MTEKKPTNFKPYAIFDMDGTLIDSMPYWEKLGPEFLQKQGITSDLTQTLSDIKTMTLSESAELFVRRFHLDMTAKEAENSMEQMMENHYLRDIPLKPGMGELLERMSDAGVTMCVVTITEETLMNACLKRLGILDWFKFTLSCETFHTHKRDPWIYAKAAEMLGAKPEETAVCEDALHALKTAKQAGFYTVAVYDIASHREWDEMVRISDRFIKY